MHCCMYMQTHIHIVHRINKLNKKNKKEISLVELVFKPEKLKSTYTFTFPNNNNKTLQLFVQEKIS